MEKKALLVVSFGTSFEETRARTIDVIERDLQRTFPDRKFYRAWTSDMIRKKLDRTVGVHYDSVREAMEKIVADGVTDLLVQPTHMLAGCEYAQMRQTVAAYCGKIAAVAVGAPLLTTPQDLSALAEIMERAYAGLEKDELLILMGHGSDQLEMPVYELLNDLFAERGHSNICVGTVEFSPGIEPALARVRERSPRRVYLAPLLIVAGDHATNDMASDEPDSWKSRIAQNGPEVVCILKGLGEYEAVRAMYVANAEKAAALCNGEQANG